MHTRHKLDHFNLVNSQRRLLFAPFHPPFYSYGCWHFCRYPHTWRATFTRRLWSHLPAEIVWWEKNKPTEVAASVHLSSTVRSRLWPTLQSKRGLCWTEEKTGEARGRRKSLEWVNVFEILHIFFIWGSLHHCFFCFFTNVKWKLVEYSGKTAASLKKPQMCNVCRWGLLEDNAQGGKWLTYVGITQTAAVCVSNFLFWFCRLWRVHTCFPEVFLNI